MSIIQAQGYYQHRYNTNSEGDSAVGCNLQFAQSVSLKRQSISSSGGHTPPSSSSCSSFNYSPSSSIPRVNYGTFSPLTGTKFFACSVSELPYIVTTLVAYILDDGNSILLDKKISEFGWSCCDNDPTETSGTCKFAVTMHLDSAKDRVITKFRRLDGCAQTFTRVVQQFCEYRNVAGHARRVDAMTKVESCIVAIGSQIPAALPKPQSHSQPLPRLEHEQAVAFVPLKAAKSSLASSPKMLGTSDAGAGAAATTGSLVLSSAHSSARACVASCKMFANWMKSDPTEALQSLLKAMPKLWLDFVLSLDAPSSSSFEQPQQQLLLFSASSSSGEPTLQELRNAMSALYAALCLVVAQCLHALQTSEQSARAAACAAASASPASVSVSVPAVASSSSSSNNSSDNKHWRTAAAVQRALEQQQLHHQQQQEEEQGGAGFFCSYAEATAARDDTATVYRAISFAEASSFSSFSSFSLPPSALPFHQSSTTADMETKFGNVHLHPATALGGKTTAAAACWAPAPMQSTSAAVGAAQDGIQFVNLCDTDPLLGSVVPEETRAVPARRQQQQQQPLIPLSAEFTQRLQTSNATHMLMQFALPDTSRVLFLALSCLAGFAQGGRGVMTPRSRSVPGLPPRVGSFGPSGLKTPAMPPRPAMLRRGTSMAVPRAEEEQDPMFTPRQSEVIEELVVNLLLENAELKHAVLVLPDLLEALVHAPALPTSSSSSVSSAAPAPSAVPAMERDIYAALSEQFSCPSSSSHSATVLTHGSSGGGSVSGEACAGCYMCNHTRKNLALLRKIGCFLGC